MPCSAMMNLKSLIRTAKQRQQQQHQHADKSQKEEEKTAADDDAALLPAARRPLPLLDQASYLSLPLPSLSPPPLLSARHAVCPAPPRCFYIADWCDAEDEAAMLRCCRQCPRDSWIQLRGRRLQCWGNTPLPPSVSPSSTSSSSSPSPSALHSALPLWLQSVIDRVVQTGIFTAANDSLSLPVLPRPDHVLLNAYEAGQGITAHQDGPAYHPLVVIISLSSSCVMHFYTQPPPSIVYSSQPPLASSSAPSPALPVLSLLLQPRSLLVFTDALYTRYFHCIHEVQEDVVDDSIHNLQQAMIGSSNAELPVILPRSTRFSLTIRTNRPTAAAAD